MADGTNISSEQEPDLTMSVLEMIRSENLEPSVPTDSATTLDDQHDIRFESGQIAKL